MGYWFELHEHPELDQHSDADKEFLITTKTFYNQNNLPKDLSEQIQHLLKQSQWSLKTSTVPSERQANHLSLQRRHITTVPVYNPIEHRPATHPQRAKVVGPSGEEIHVDEWGRIKVRFLFTRNDDHSHDGGAGTNDNDTDSAWVDVLPPWAGEGYGARFLPRIGEIVVIDFFDGNLDRPFVVGRIHEAQRSPTKFDQKGQLPETKKLAGIRSKEVGGEGYNQLRFDDTTGQISTQLQSSHGATQLNLGNLSHPKERETSEGRGEGFELRTDQWGAIRAGDGLLLSSYKQDRAAGTHLDAQPAKQQLEGTLNNSQALSEVAKNQQTDPLEVLENLKGFLELIEQQDQNKADAFKQAIMILSAPNSVAVSSNEDIYLSADGQISQSAGESINLSTQKSLIAHASDKISLFAAQDGLRAYAGKGKVEIQAQGDALDVIARKDIQIISTEDTVYITSPTEINLTAGGSQIKMNGTGIFSTTAGKFESKAGQHQFLDGGKVISSSISLPKIGEKNAYDLKMLVKDNDGNIKRNMKYYFFLANGSKVEGITDDNGYTKTITTIQPEKADLHLINDELINIDEIDNG